MKAANAAAAMRGTSAEVAGLAAVATCPDMCAPICTARYVISIEDRLQPAFFALTSAPRDRRDPNRHPLAPCRGTVGRHQPAILSFEAGHVPLFGAARPPLGPVISLSPISFPSLSGGEFLAFVFPN